MKKTKVFVDEYKGSEVFQIWEVDEDGEKSGNYPIVSMGRRKMKAVLTNLDKAREFVADKECT